MSSRWLIAGLGNPGAKYSKTRHNAGFWFLDDLDRACALNWKAERKFHGELGRGRLGQVDILALRPDTFMNESGRALRSVMDYFEVPAEQVLVAYDDLDLAPGVVRLKFGGGHGGHNGLRSMFAHLGAPGFWRLRIGIGHPGVREAVTPWVLSRPAPDDDSAIRAAIDRAVAVIEPLLHEDAGRAQQALHTTAGEDS